MKCSIFGILNPFFLGRTRRSYGNISMASRRTGNAISVWISIVTGGGHRGGGPIDAWTSQIGG